MASADGRLMWERNTSTLAALLALDVCGFSEDTQPDQLLAHREALFHAVREAPIVPELVEQGLVKIQFVGDELRFAFRGNIPQRARKVRSFVDAIFDNLQRAGNTTRLKGVVLSGELIWRKFHECDFFDGSCAVSCSDWLGCVTENQIVINEAFKKELNTDGVSTSSFPQVRLVGDTGFLLRS